MKQEVAMPVADITFPQEGQPSAWSSATGQDQVQLASQQASCSVLNLTLGGPLDLNLLGLRFS